MPTTLTDTRCPVCKGLVVRHTFKPPDPGGMWPVAEVVEYFCSVCGIMYKFLPKEKPDGSEEEKEADKA